MADWSAALSSRLDGGDELSATLAGTPDGVLSMTGGFPNAATFPDLGDIAGRVFADDGAVALQYTPVAGIASVREYLRYARPDATDEENEEAARAGQIHGLIASLPVGYEAVRRASEVQPSSNTPCSWR